MAQPAAQRHEPLGRYLAEAAATQPQRSSSRMFAGWGEEGLALLMLGGFRWCIDVYGGQRDLFIFFNIYFCMKLYTYIVEPLSIANVLRFWFAVRKPSFR